jgi:hypothetical protein
LALTGKSFVPVNHLRFNGFPPELEFVMSDKTREGADYSKSLSASGAGEAHAGHGSAASKPNERRAHQKAITQGLRKFFDTVAAEPVPDEFLELLKKMDDEKGGGA